MLLATRNDRCLLRLLLLASAAAARSGSFCVVTCEFPVPGYRFPVIGSPFPVIGHLIPDTRFPIPDQMPRPRKVTDEQVFAAAHRATMRLAPSEVTLAEIASEAGVTAGALAQRFGSKRELLLALARAAATSSGDFIAQLKAAHRSPLAAVRAYGECMAQLAQSPAALARNLAYLQIDLADPDFREQLAVQARATRAGLIDLLSSAVDAGELKRTTDIASLARTVEAMVSGSMMTWAFYAEGPAEKWIRDDVNAVLAPHLAVRRRRR